VCRAPATPDQEALWWAHQGDASPATLNLHWRLSLDGEVDAGSLRLAWAALVQRHEALRTGFSLRAGSLLQEVRATAAGSLALVAWDDDDGELCERLGQELHGRRFDLGRPPLARAVLLRAGARRELHVCGHRAVLDDACLPVLLRDLFTAYRALSRGHVPAFDVDPVPFRVFAAEEREALDQGRWRASEEHWRSELAGARPARLAASPTHGWRGDLDVAVLRVPLSDEAAGAVRSLGADRGAEPVAVCLAALRAVLGRAQAGAPTAVGIVAPNRLTVRDQAIVGPLANTVAVAGRVDAADSLRTLVTRARRTMEAVRRHGHVPLPAVLAALDGDGRRRMRAGPAIVLLGREEPETTPALAGVPLRSLPRAGSGAGGDVGVQVGVVTSRAGLALELEYRTALFDRRTIAALASDLDRTVALAARAPDLEAGAVPVRTRTVAVAPEEAPPAGGVPPASPGLAAGGERSRSSLVTLRAGARPHVHLFHPGGGGTAHYQALVAALPARWTVTASDDSGQGDTIEDLAERYVRDVLSSMGPPDVLGGWSMGGLLAYEAVRQLRGTVGRPPALLLVDSPPPVGYGPEPDGRRVIEGFAESLWMSLSLRRFRPLEVDAADGEAMCALAAGLWRAGEAAGPDFLLQRLEEYRRHLRAVLRYVCADRVPVPAVVVAAELDEPHLDEWRRRLVPGTPVVRVEGGHFDVLRTPLVAEVARLLTSLADERTRNSLPPGDA
jgi:thioesterase domain-containing protein